jgi:hypothetical protein
VLTPGRLLILAALILPSSAAPASELGLPVQFLLVPLERWNEGQPAKADVLPEGTIRLFRAGEYEAALEFPANTTRLVPPGVWVWIAESPGYVSAGSGTLNVQERVAPARNVLWPVLPACRITLGAASAWHGIDRVDFVSIDHRATYPVRPGRERSVAVPGGRWLAYAVGARGLVGITKPRACAASQELHLRTIAPPPADREELLVHVDLPEETEVAAGELNALVGGGPGGPGIRAAGKVWSARRVSFFFLDLPISGERRIEVAHPKLRRVSLRQEAVGGRAFELPPIAARARRAMTFQIDYRPKGEHREEQLVLVACGERPASSALQDSSECPGPRHEERLRPGLEVYRFGGLDDGQYFIEANIDGLVVQGLGSGLVPYLRPETEGDLALGPVLLRELEIYGHLLVDDEPVAGEVRFVPPSRGYSSQTVFPTDADLTYHFRYFGHRYQEESSEIPEEGKKLLGNEELGIYWSRGLSACDAEGACRAFNIHSTFTGEGRWDIDLGSRTILTVEVTDAETGKPLPGVTVLTDPTPAVHFVRGRVFEAMPEGIEGQGFFTDRYGRARLRVPKPESFGLAVAERGFRPYRTRLSLPGGGDHPLPVALERESDGGEVTLRLAGRPVPGAFLLAVDGSGRRRPDCLAATGAKGGISLPATCRKGVRFVVMHPAVALQIVDAGSWLATGLVDLAPAPDPPLRLRLVTAGDRPLSAVPVSVRLADLVLGPNDLLLATAKGASPLFYQTDQQGEIVLAGVTPDLAVVVPGARGDLVLELATTPPGGVAILRVE